MEEPDPERAAMTFVTHYLRRQGYDVRDVSGDRSFRGFDLLATRDGVVVRIEVKGCTRPWGIPDPYHTEFDEDRRLVADFLYVVYFLAEESTPKLCIIPREAIDPMMVTERRGYRISGRFTKASVLEKFLVPAGDDETVS